jgi:hypothetical protein
MKKVLATIKLDGIEGRGELFWMDGSIWCREPSGNEYDTETRSEEENAVSTIQQVWSHSWDLEIVRD